MLGENIKKHRRAKKMNQTDFAEYMNVSQATVTLWERNLRRPDIDALWKMADFFSTSLDDLVGRTDDPAPPQKTMKEILAEDPNLPELDTLAASYDGPVSEEYKREIARQVALAMELYEKKHGKKFDEE